MNSETRSKLKTECRTMLDRSNIKPSSKKGKEMAWAFWFGVLKALDEANPDPYISILLMSGRIEDLIGEPACAT